MPKNRLKLNDIIAIICVFICLFTLLSGCVAVPENVSQVAELLNVVCGGRGGRLGPHRLVFIRDRQVWHSTASFLCPDAVPESGTALKV